MKKQNSEKNLRKFFKIFKENFLWIIICICILLACIFLPELYFKKIDEKTFNSTETNAIEYVNLSISNNLSLYDKIAIINNGYTETDLNYDYTDEYSYSDVHDITMTELNDLFFVQMDIPIYIDGIYEMIIEKHLIISEKDSSQNFTAWVIEINYFGFKLNLMLDYDTHKIISLNFDVNPENNTYYDAEKIEKMEYYDTAILPILEFLEDRYGESKSENYDVYVVSDEFASIFASYYDIDGIIDGIYETDFLDNSIGVHEYFFTYKDVTYNIILISEEYSLKLNE